MSTSDALLARTLEHLAALVACDTQNPPRAVLESGLYDYVARALSGFVVDVQDFGDGAVTLYARRGAPEVLINVHVDTVPRSDAWTRDPFDLLVTGERAVGLGACDIKGALAAFLACVESLPDDAPAALLLCSDEEGGGSRSARGWLAGRTHDYAAVLVAEPTRGHAVAAHRGYCAIEATFRADPGHSSAPRTLRDNALHQAARWTQECLFVAEQAEAEAVGDLRGICFNLGTVRGGTADNVIAPEAVLRASFRPLPGQSAQDVIDRLLAGSAAKTMHSFRVIDDEPSLPAAGGPASDEVATQLGLPPGAPVAFWTEAALFSAAGLPAVVFGPGDIEQAHTADEWVALDELRAVADVYDRVLRQKGGA